MTERWLASQHDWCTAPHGAPKRRAVARKWYYSTPSRFYTHSPPLFHALARRFGRQAERRRILLLCLEFWLVMLRNGFKMSYSRMAKTLHGLAVSSSFQARGESRLTISTLAQWRIMTMSSFLRCGMAHV